MPYRTFDAGEAARYLHLSRADIDRLVKDRDIPFELHGARVVFRKVEIDAWASRRIMGLEARRLAEYHRLSSREPGAQLACAAIMPEMLYPDYIDPALPAKTKASVLREMAALARKTGRVCDPKGLLEGLQAREELCSTGLPGGLALLHPRVHDPYLFEKPFIVLGRTVQEIPFGAPDGRPTRLFFLLGCPDDRLHLHTLARLCLMAQKTAMLEELLAAPEAGSMHQVILTAEEAVLAGQRPQEPAAH